jgi:hypothetical protein
VEFVVARAFYQVTAGSRWLLTPEITPVQKTKRRNV